MIRKLIIFIFVLVGINLFFLQSECKNTSTKKSGIINLNVKDVDIKDLARMFSEVSGLNIIVGDDVKAKVTMNISNVNWKDALDIILKTYNLVSVREGNFLRIMTYEKFRREEEGTPLENKVVFLNFVKAEDILRVLEPMKSSRGRITAHPQTNTLVITDTPNNIRKMMEVIKKLDKKTPQVMIEVLMVDVKLGDESQLGVEWVLTHKQRPERKIEQHLSAQRAEAIIRYGKTLLPKAAFTALIDMWCQERRAQVLANPKIITLDGLTATIELVEEVPYVESTVSSETGAITSTVSFRDAGIKLYVTPHITKENYISLNLKTEQSFRSGIIEGQPIIDSRKAETNLLVKNGETIVIGGLRKKDTSNTIDKFPLLGDLPLIGKIFQRNVKSSSDSELLIFVTPSIVTEPELSFYEKEHLKKFMSLKWGKFLYFKRKPFSLRGPKW